jgi:hypothetical protein
MPRARFGSLALAPQHERGARWFRSTDIASFKKPAPSNEGSGLQSFQEQTVEDKNKRGALTVAYQGERGAFSEDAARKLLGPDIETLPCRTFEEMFDAVSSGTANAAAAPIENSLAGSVHKNYDLLMEHDLTITGETNLRIVHHLIAPRGLRLEDVRRVHSHPVALAQCEKFLRANPRIEVAPAYDTAGSVKMIIETMRRTSPGFCCWLGPIERNRSRRLRPPINEKHLSSFA